MVFRVIGIGYKSRLLVVDGSINAEKYIENCSTLGFIDELDEQRGQFEWIFQQDGATCHTTADVLDWLEMFCDVLQGWPSNSPDLSPIEICWAVLKRMVSLMNPQTIPQLKECLLNAWDAISQTSIDNLCKSFRARLIMCRDREGQSISNDLWLLSDKQFVEELTNPLPGDRRVNTDWSFDEGRELIELHAIFRSNWQRMATYLGRPPWQLKIRWNTVLKKREERLLQNTDYQMEVRSRARLNHPL
jgi:hypothetical protein